LVQYIYQQNIYSNFYIKTFKNIKFIYKYENIIIYICNVTEYVKKEYTKHSHIYIYGLSTSQKKKRKQLWRIMFRIRYEFVVKWSKCNCMGNSLQEYGKCILPLRFMERKSTKQKTISKKRIPMTMIFGWNTQLWKMTLAKNKKTITIDKSNMKRKKKSEWKIIKEKQSAYLKNVSIHSKET